MACGPVSIGKAEAVSFVGLKGSYEVSDCDQAGLASAGGFVERFRPSHFHLDGLM